MRALRVRLVGLGTSLVLVVTSLVGAGTALADHDNNVAVACSNADIATSGGANGPSSNNVAIAISAATHWWPINIIVAVATSGGANGPSSNIVQATSTVVGGEGAVSSGTDVRCVAVATRD